MNIELQGETEKTPSREEVAHWVDSAITFIPKCIPEKQNAITIRFVDEAESAELNETYRGKSGPTNVLAFEDHPLGGIESDSLGDLAICTEVVIQESKGKPAQGHWAHMVIHGLLHLLGYDHLQEGEAQEMEALESKILVDLGFEDPYR